MFSWTHRRIATIFFMGFSSGLPLALVSSTLQAWFTVSGASLATIGWLTLVGQPYALKFLWAPLLDRFTPLFLGRRRAWIALMQLGLALCFLVIAFLNPQHVPKVIALVAVIAAIFSATQDMAIDAYRTELLSEQESGVGVSANTVAYRLAMVVSSAIALLIAARWGWRLLYVLMSICFFCLFLVTQKSSDPVATSQFPRCLKEAIIAPMREFFSRKNAVIILIFIMSYKLCDAMALSLNTTFLMRGAGFDLVQIGSVSKIIGLLASLLGSVIGGLWLPRLGLYRALFGFGFLQMTSNLLYTWLAVVGHQMTVMAVAMFGEYFCGGLATVAFIVLLMRLCDQRYTATQYALFSAFAAVGRIFIGPLSAFVVARVGWVDFYIVSTLIGLPSLWILWRWQSTLIAQNV